MLCHYQLQENLWTRNKCQHWQTTYSPVLRPSQEPKTESMDRVFRSHKRTQLLSQWDRNIIKKRVKVSAYWLTVTLVMSTPACSLSTPGTIFLQMRAPAWWWRTQTTMIGSTDTNVRPGQGMAATEDKQTSWNHHLQYKVTKMLLIMSRRCHVGKVWHSELQIPWEEMLQHRIIRYFLIN